MATGKRAQLVSEFVRSKVCPLTCGHIQHMYSWWWVGLSPETCRVKAFAENKTQLLHLVGFIFTTLRRVSADRLWRRKVKRQIFKRFSFSPSRVWFNWERISQPTENQYFLEIIISCGRMIKLAELQWLIFGHFGTWGGCRSLEVWNNSRRTFRDNWIIWCQRGYSVLNFVSTDRGNGKICQKFSCKSWEREVIKPGVNILHQAY